MGVLGSLRQKLAAPRWQLAFVFLVLVMLRFFPFLMGKTLVFGDNYSLMVPGKLFTAAWLREGVLPLWNPTIFAGIPWAGDVNQSILYPSTLLFTVFHPAVALNLTLLTHILLSFSGMYLLGRRLLLSHYSALVATVLWSASTQLTGSMNNISTIQSLAYLPAIVYVGLGVTRSIRSRLLFALLVLLQFAGGYPTHVIYSILLAVGFSVIEEKPYGTKNSFLAWVGSWSVTGFLAVGLSAVIWLPFTQTLSQSTRTIQTQVQAKAGSLHPLELIKILFPYFFDHPSRGYKWGPSWNRMPNVSLYLSWIGLASMFAFARRALKDRSKYLAWAMVMILLTLFAMGENLPLDISFLTGSSRGPSVALIAVNLVASLAAAKYLFKMRIDKRVMVGISLFLLGCLAGLVVTLTSFEAIWLGLDRLTRGVLAHSTFHTVARDQKIVKFIMINGAVNSGLFLLAGFFLKKKRQLLLVLVLLVDLVFNTQSMLIFAPNRVYLSHPDQFAFADQVDPQSRWLIRNFNAPYTDFGAYWEALVVRKPFSDSYIGDVEQREFNHLRRMARGMTPDWNMVAGVDAINGYTTLMTLDTNELWNSKTDPAINNLPPIELSNPNLQNWAVKYYLVDNWYKVTEDLKQFELLDTRDHWSLYRMPALARFRYEDDTSALVREVEENPNKIRLRVSNDQDYQWLIIADRYDSDWRALVNGRQVEVEEFNQMRRVKLEPGENEVELYYQPSNFYLGLAITLVFGLGSLVWLLIVKNHGSHSDH